MKLPAQARGALPREIYVVVAIFLSASALSQSTVECASGTVIISCDFAPNAICRVQEGRAWGRCMGSPSGLSGKELVEQVLSEGFQKAIRLSDSEFRAAVANQEWTIGDTTVTFSISESIPLADEPHDQGYRVEPDEEPGIEYTCAIHFIGQASPINIELYMSDARDPAIASKRKLCGEQSSCLQSIESVACQ